MTVSEVFELRKQGLIEEAYSAIRPLYAVDKGAYTSLAMFWTAVDILRKRLREGNRDEAHKIFRALERMMPSVPDKEGWVKTAFEKCKQLIADEDSRMEVLDEEGPEHLRMGVWGEELATVYLREKGYVILARDWHSGHRDIDIVAQDGDTTVFVEVKTRHDRNIVEPIHSIDAEKLHNLSLAINHYIKQHHIENPCRFDVILIVGELSSVMPEITHIEDFDMNESLTHRWHKKDKRW
jgi:uncharacterized protein (TIGR00252 family)